MSYKVTTEKAASEKFQTFLHSRGSLEELVDDLNICFDEKYLSSDEVAKLKEKARGVLILINGHLRYLRSRGSNVRESDGAESDFDDVLEALPL